MYTAADEGLGAMNVGDMSQYAAADMSQYVHLQATRCFNLTCQLVRV